ncbi:hypothetical protein [Rhodococcus sp. BH5]|uniref:hypothetical protein n=1 Tax=Rhodococcus sp. BH5 TaxID=2871702 RepID=UPI0022CD2C30|nr:hypothetical protein [Rhodococcus sp. BH5]MCZ9635286.1 hypothetical protein [Rhodococcus sp. BH5]
MSPLDDSLPWPPPDGRADLIRELRRENATLLALVVDIPGAGVTAGPRAGQTRSSRKRHALQILRAIGKADNDCHVAHYVRLGRQYGLTCRTIAALIDRPEDDIRAILDKAGDG